MRKWITPRTLGVLMLFGATLAYGQTLHRSFELSAMGGIRVYDEDVVFLSSGWVAGGKLAWFPHANIGVEGTVSFSSADVSLDEVGGDETDFTVDVTEVRVDGVYQMLFQLDQKIVPYFSAGVGQMVFDAGEESGVTDEPVTNLTYGGGLKIWFTPRIALRLDARDNVALIDKTFASESGIPTPNTKTFQANNPEFQAGLTIGFGGSEEDFGRRDTDFDGVPDKDDLCPNTPRGVMVDETGCPIEVEEEALACLDDQSWYTSDATINVDGRNWVKFGSTKTATPDQLTQMGEYQGVPAYVGNNATRPYREIWLPLCSPENTYQPYRLESEVRGTTGYIRDAN